MQWRFFDVARIYLLLGSTVLQAATYDVAQNHPDATDDGPGTPERPWKSITQAALVAKAGDLVLIREGVYRERVVIKNHGTSQEPIRFEAAPGAHVVLTGADRLTGWRKTREDQPVYQVPWAHRFITWSKQMTHPGDEYHRVIGRCEQVFVENRPLRQVLEVGQLAPGSFFVDTTNGVLHAWDPGNRDLNKVYAEASVRQDILRIEGDHVHVRGIKFRLAANMAQRGALVLSGKHVWLEDSIIEEMNANGATFSGEDQVVRRCTFRDNGQLGFSASRAHRLLFTECIVENNNTKGFDRGWEAGGNKLALCRDVILEKSQFVRNRGNGIWFDIGNENCTVRHCLIADNEDSGIFYEISFGLKAHDNVIIGNGFATTPGAWGAQAGISISSSPGCVIERNIIAGNREGFNFREQPRTTPLIGQKVEVPVWCHDEEIRKNIIALNRDAQVWGWFDLKDDRHWPSSGQHALPESQQAPATPRLSLPDLRLRFEGNVYFASPGQGAFNWGTSWGRHTNYANLAEFQTELGIDTGGSTRDPGFVDILKRDYRLGPNSPDAARACYPQGEVPRVLLGKQGL